MADSGSETRAPEPPPPPAEIPKQTERPAGPIHDSGIGTHSQAGARAEADTALKAEHDRATEPAGEADDAGAHRDTASQATDERRDEAADQPDFANAEIDQRKIDGYVMNPEHPVGKHKYRVINSATGLDTGDSQGIRDQILDKVQDAQPVPGREDEHGKRWNAEVELTGPNGTVTVTTGWIVDHGSTTPRLVTISFPREKDR